MSRTAAVLFAAAMLSAGFCLLDITWLNFVYSLAVPLFLAAPWFVTHRDELLMSEATRKTTRHHVKRRGEQVTIKMVGTPK